MSIQVFVPYGSVLTITPNASSAGTYLQQADPGATIHTPVAFSAGASAIVLGPFNEARTYRINSVTGEASYSLATAIDNLVSPTFSGTVVLPSTTSIGNVSATELAYIHGVTSAVQTQLDAKVSIASPAFTGSPTIAKVNGTESTNAVTTNGAAGVITTSALTTAAGGSYVITWTNSSILTTSAVLLSWAGGTNTIRISFIVVAGSGSATLTINNINLLSALNGTVKINYLVL